MRGRKIRRAPDGAWERSLRRGGQTPIAGVDEAGRGCLAGPVVAAAVILRPGARIPGLRDSKLLSPAARNRVASRVLRGSIAWGIGAVAPRGIDRRNIRRASFRAMRIAVRRLGIVPGHILVDGFRLPGIARPQTGIVRGDRRCRSIAAASVIAKVARDRRMERYERRHPGYGFSAHRGYPTPEHLEALLRLGPCPIHRRSFRPVQAVLRGPGFLPL